MKFFTYPAAGPAAPGVKSNRQMVEETRPATADQTDTSGSPNSPAVDTPAPNMGPRQY